jgi:hypothetical protein
MNKEIFIKIINQPEVYLPTIILFWVLGQRNNLLDLIILVLTFFFLIYQDNIIRGLLQIVDKKNVKKLLKQKKRDKALNVVLKNINTTIMRNVPIFGMMLLTVVLLNIYTFYRIIPFWKQDIAKFFLIVGGLAILNKLIFYLKNFRRYVKIIIKEEI